MKLIIAKDSVNTDALHAALQQRFGSAYKSLSTSPGYAVVYLDDAATPAQQAEAQAAVAAHDARALTDAQQAAALQAAYEAEGATFEAMLLALWEKVANGKTDADAGITDLKAKREKVKKDAPAIFARAKDPFNF